MDSFSALLKISKKKTLLEGTKALLSWDLETYMPKDGASVRAEKIELLSSLIHQELLSPTFEKELKALQQEKNLSKEQQAACRLWTREHEIAKKQPSDFVKELSRETSASLQAWIQAKEENDYSLLEPHMQKVITLCQKQADLLGYKEHPYDAMIDLYEEGMDKKTLEALFKELKPALVSLLQKIPRQEPKSYGVFPSKGQKELNAILLGALGFSKETSRLDESLHPFCSGIHPLDTRMTTRIDENNPLYSILSVVHEGGHGQYNRNLPKELYGSPVCAHASLGMDESQSRLFEATFGTSRAFWSYLYPHMQKTFPGNLQDVSFEEYLSHVNRVEPSFIRTEADEVTYCLHIILRFEIEVLLLEGTITATEIPSVWGDKMEELLDIRPTSDQVGCLQDIHWPIGAIGYFPTYAIGNLVAAELFSLLKKDIPNYENDLAKGNFANITAWLKENVHRHGALYTPKELLKKITGKELSPNSYIAYLEEKFLP